MLPLFHCEGTNVIAIFYDNAIENDIIMFVMSCDKCVVENSITFFFNLFVFKVKESLSITIKLLLNSFGTLSLLYLPSHALFLDLFIHLASSSNSTFASNHLTTIVTTFTKNNPTSCTFQMTHTHTHMDS